MSTERPDPKTPSKADRAELSLDTLDRVVGGAGANVRSEDATQDQLAAYTAAQVDAFAADPLTGLDDEVDDPVPVQDLDPGGTEPARPDPAPWGGWTPQQADSLGMRIDPLSAPPDGLVMGMDEAFAAFLDPDDAVTQDLGDFAGGATAAYFDDRVTGIKEGGFSAALTPGSRSHG
jgi:hypothetical protein